MCEKDVDAEELRTCQRSDWHEPFILFNSSLRLLRSRDAFTSLSPEKRTKCRFLHAEYFWTSYDVPRA